MIKLSEIKKSILVSIWFMFLTFPIIVVKISQFGDSYELRWNLMAVVGWSCFFISFIWRFFIEKRTNNDSSTIGVKKKIELSFIFLLAVFPILFSFLKSEYQLSYLIIGALFALLCLVIVIYFNSIQTINLFIGYLFSYIHLLFIKQKEKIAALKLNGILKAEPFTSQMTTNPAIYYPSITVFSAFILLFPLIFLNYAYVTGIFTTALMYVALGLGLNIVVGLAGLLDLGYVAFYAVGAYLYGLLNFHFGLGFWISLPLGALIAACFGLMLGFPVLRLRGDYLAIVTLGFGEIIRLILENWDKVFFGPSGIKDISRPAFFGIELFEKSLIFSISYMYYIVLFLVILTIFFVNRLKHSRLGRAWQALREDEIACQSMGINKMRTKLAAFSLGATWAGIMGVVYAAKQTFINPISFTFMESVIILSIVVLGGMGSILGVSIAAIVLTILPYVLSGIGSYKWLVFGAVLVVMMVFKPKGLIQDKRKNYYFDDNPETDIN